MIHSVKCSSNYFLDLLSGRKTFELRFDDRDYKVGDYLAVNETKHFEHSDEIFPDNITIKALPNSSESDVAYSGRCLLFKITYVLKDTKFLVSGMVALGLKRIELPYDDQDIEVDTSNFRYITDYANGKEHT